jgi:hypothetical protein
VTATAIVPTTETLEVPGARLSYDVRRNDESTDPILFLIAAPMAAAGFGTLAGHFTDRTVVTYDPRGSERSELTEPTIQIRMPSWPSYGTSWRRADRWRG